MRIVLGLAILGATCFGQTHGTWRLDSTHSTFNKEIRPRSLSLRIEQHPKGEVLTFDRVERDGRVTSSSTVLYLDGASRDVEDFGCTGTQSSRRIDEQTVEMVRVCGNGESSKTTRWRLAHPNELILEIRVRQADGRQFEDRLVLRRQPN
jgi:hypothetical protein